MAAPSAHEIDKTVELTIPGHERTAYLTGGGRDQSVIGAIEHAHGFYEPRIMEAIGDILAPDSIALDIGANIGALSIAMSWASPHGLVYAFEASRSNYRHLCLNVGENTPGNVVPAHLALWDEATTLEISYVPHVAGCSFHSPSGVREGATELVAARPLDEWVEEAGLTPDRPIRLIKLDVEGAESRVLRGARGTLEAHQPQLLIEFNPEPIERFFDDDPRALAELLLEIFPMVDAFDPDGGPLHPIDSYARLTELMASGASWLDLYCRFQ
jgi:FkbM family methyltransferase